MSGRGAEGDFARVDGLRSISQKGSTHPRSRRICAGLTLAVDFDDFPAALCGRQALAVKLCRSLLHRSRGFDAFDGTDLRKPLPTDYEFGGGTSLRAGLLGYGHAGIIAYLVSDSMRRRH